jgi:hypothetical protein
MSEPAGAVVEPSRKIREFSQRNNRRGERVLLPSLIVRGPRLPPGFARGPPSLIIRDLPRPHSLPEIHKRYAIIKDQHAFLEETGGRSQMLAQIATLGEIEAYPVWREAREARERAAQAVLVQAERARLRRERKDAHARAEYEKRRAMRVSPLVGIFRCEGRRVERATPLTEAELYLNDARPPSILSPPLLLTCALCFNLKSHPVSCVFFFCFAASPGLY